MSDPAKLAAAAQSSAGYLVDVWTNVTLEPMTKLWQGLEGPPAEFFFSEHDAYEAMGMYTDLKPHRFAETLWRLAQVRPSASHGYRQGIREFVVDLPTPAAVGICSANGALGSGSVYQYFIPGWRSTVYMTGREYRFHAKAYP